MSDYEKYLLQLQAEQSPRHNDMTLDERITEYIEWQNDGSYRDLMVDAHLEIIKLRAENARLAAELAAAQNRILQLEAWVREEGNRGSICTYDILNKEICSGCLCGRSPK